MFDDVVQLRMKLGSFGLEVSFDEFLEGLAKRRIENGGRDARDDDPDESGHHVARNPARSTSRPDPSFDEGRSNHADSLLRCSCNAGCRNACSFFRAS
jgi:hypothetical protein